ncbi:sensor histidine kinase [Pseudonocardia sichuanensis]
MAGSDDRSAGNSIRAGTAMTSDARAARDLIKVALDPECPGTIGDLARVVAVSTGSRGAVLWEAPDEMQGVHALSVLALWVADLDVDGTRAAVTVDPITLRSLDEQSLEVGDDIGTGPRLYDEPVRAAVPIRFADGCRGVLTLLGAGMLSGEDFDIVVDMVELLPELCSAVRERQTLALVNACNTILHDVDVESPGPPPSRQRLGEHLAGVCDRVAAALQCAEVSIYLREPDARSDEYRLLATSSGASPDPCAGTTDPVDLIRSGLAERDEPLMEVRLVLDGTVGGLLRCRGSVGPPHHFTTSDFALLRPIAAQVGRYWRNWLQRRATCEENDSWRALTAGITTFNKIIAERLEHTDPDRTDARGVCDAALQVVRAVVPESAGAVLLLRPRRDAGSTGRELSELVLGSSAGSRCGASVGSGAVDVMRGRVQNSVTDRRELAAEGFSESIGWLLRTPVSVGEQVYGVLESAGPEARLPANSAQVHQIIADQIGLYRHLQDTLGHLTIARRRLEVALRAEAEAMEDLKHQLVSPLRTAAGRAELVLMSRRFDPRTEGQLRAIRGLCRKASRVAMSAGVFATLSKGEKPTAKLELFGIDDLLRTLIAAADDAQVLGDPHRRISFDVDREAVRAGLQRRLVEVDASFLQQCVGNLLDNAAKYAYPDTRVRIAADVAAAGLTLTVHSVGLPLAPQDVQRCLRRNWRGKAARATTGEGSGIGLWIVENLMRAMHGQVSVRVNAEETAVGLTLPLA